MADADRPLDAAIWRKRRPLKIGGELIPPGAVRDIHLPFSEAYTGSKVTLPLRIMRAPKPGPHIFLTGVVHGDELNGLGIVSALMNEDMPTLRRGTIIFVPVVNVFGLEHHTRYLPDRRDLNRSFPGNAGGSISARLAYILFHEVIQQCDFGIDFHTAAVRRTNYPNIRGDLRDKGTRWLARTFGLELIVDGKGPSGSLRNEATKAGVPTIILEAGEVWKVEPTVLQMGVWGTLNVLRALDMITGEAQRPTFQTVIDRTVWVRAEHGGVLGFHMRPGELVRTGDALATLYSVFGRERRTIVSPVDGIVLGMTTMPAVKPGGPVYHIARLSQRTLRRIRQALGTDPLDNPYLRIQRDLATNVVIRPTSTTP